MKKISAATHIKTEKQTIEFQFTYGDGTEEAFQCSQATMREFVLAVGAESTTTRLNTSEAATNWSIARDDATGRIGVQLLYPGNKRAIVRLEREQAENLGQALVRASIVH